MKKILTGIFLIALTVGLVSGAAYALFSDVAQVKGIAITAGNADLKIALDKLGGGTYETGYGDSQTFWSTLNNYLLGNMYPGYTNWGYFRVKNSSLSNIPLTLSARLTAATNWENILKDNVQFAIADENGTFLVGYHTLNWWNAADRSLNMVLNHNDNKTLRLYVRVLSSAGNEIAGLSLTNVVFDITGTQQ